jgi:hypothetical protein
MVEEECWESGEGDRAGLGCVAGGGDRGGDRKGRAASGKKRDDGDVKDEGWFAREGDG